MRIVYIIAGSGQMECDMCLRDGQLARTFKAKGHDVLFVPMYTPLSSAVGDARQHRLFFGGINIYLQQKYPAWRHAPGFLKKLLDHPALLNFVARFGHMTQASDLAELTISMMEGEEGAQRRELDELLGWLAEQPRPDAVILPTSLLAGLAAPMRKRLGAPVLCLLSGEDMFIDQFPEPHRARTLETLRRRAREIDGFMAASAWYAEFMAGYLAVEADKVKTMTPGIDAEAWRRAEMKRPETFTIGYRAQINEPNGLHVLAEALRILKAKPETAACRVRAAGHLAPGDKKYFAEIEANIRKWGLAESFKYVGELDPSERIEFLSGIHVFTVPSLYPEPIGSHVPEAMAAGAPVVLPRTGCLTEWVERTGGGVLIDKAEPGELAEAIEKLMRQPELARRLGEAGREAVLRENTLDSMADSILQRLAGFIDKESASGQPVTGAPAAQ